MKKYYCLADLIIDYRKFNRLSQLDLAANLDIDKKTIQRWENKQSTVGLDKERKLAAITLLPFQLVKNLNGKDVIPTYFDFDIHKYSLSKLTFELPDAEWYRNKFKMDSNRVRKFNFSKDFPPLKKYLIFQNQYSDNFPQLFKKSCELIPAINLVIEDEYKFYSGYSIILPLKIEAYQKLRNQKITALELSIEDLVESKQLDQAIYFEFNITADCNENYFYLSVEILKYFKELKRKNYLYSSIDSRVDSKKLSLSLGLEIIWEHTIEKNGDPIELKMYEGNFNSFFKKLK